MKLSQLRAPAIAAAAVMMASVFTYPAMAAEGPVVVGFIGSFASDTGRSTLRGAEIAIEEMNAQIEELIASSQTLDDLARDLSDAVGANNSAEAAA